MMGFETSGNMKKYRGRLGGALLILHAVLKNPFGGEIEYVHLSLCP